MRRLLSITIGALGFVALLSSCSPQSSPNPTVNAMTCQPGSVYTAQGCLAQCPTNSSEVYLNGACVPASSVTPTATAGNCPAGQVMTAMNCLPEYNGNPSFGLYNGTTPIPAMAPGTNPYGNTYGNTYLNSNPYMYPYSYNPYSSSTTTTW